jgi:hypothetical protein
MTATVRGVALVVAIAWLAACRTDRLRPGPPSLAIELPPGATVFSPDTITLGVRAHDDNGLDSVTIMILDRTEEAGAFDRVDLVTVFFWPIPEGLAPGELVDITGYAKDLVGDRTTVTTSVTVIARPAAGRAASVDPPPGRE